MIGSLIASYLSMMIQNALILFFSLAVPLFAGAVETPHTVGPNCWNTALIRQGILAVPRFTSAQEFSFLLHENCQKLGSPIRGSLGRMYDDLGEVHAFTWISPVTNFAKFSQADGETPTLMTTAKMLKTYAKKRECANDEVPRPKCLRKIDYWACHHPKAELAEEMQLLRPAEELVHELVFSQKTKFRNGDTCDHPSLAERNRILLELQTELKKLSELNHPHPKYFELWLESLNYQIHESEVVTRYYKCPKERRKFRAVEHLETRRLIGEILSFFQELNKDSSSEPQP